MGLSAGPLSRYSRRLPSPRTSTAPTSRSTRKCLDTSGWDIPSIRTSSFTDRSPEARTSRISRRLGSATALNASVVVAARAMRKLYIHIVIYQGARILAKPSNVRPMKSFLSHDRSWTYRSMLLVSACAVALGIFARLYRLGFPPNILWDERYFPVMADKYLHGVYQFDLHPPFGKFIIALGISLLGNEP